MDTLRVFLVYGTALALAAALLYFFRARWYWHLLSVMAAIGLGLIPGLRDWGVPDLAVGWTFVFLFVWGAAAPLFRFRKSRQSGRVRVAGMK